MNLAEFLESLYDSGKVLLGEYSRGPSEAEWDRARSGLCRIDARVRLDMADNAPALDPEAGLWAAVRLYHACQFLVIRELPAEAIVETFPESPKGPPSPLRPDAIYSVDLVLRALPALVRMVRTAAANDPLLAALHRLALQWPLSSVGMTLAPGIPSPEGVSALAAHPALAQLYVDRILELSDLSRLGNPSIDARVLAALGAHHNLNPKLAAALCPA